MNTKNTRSLRKAGFTLVEIMIVVAIIGLLAAIAIPNFVRARTSSQTNACINNLRQIDGAAQQWALETKQAANANVTVANITPYLKAVPACPADSAATFATSYTISTVSNSPVCQINGTAHVLP